MNPERQEQLLRQYFDGDISGSEMDELDASLQTRAEVRESFWKEAHIHGALREFGHEKASEAQLRAVAPMSELPATRRQKSWWVAWTPLTAAAAGLVVGLFFASVAWAVASPAPMATASRLFTLLDGSFEKQAGRLSSGFPSLFDIWSGDEADVVEGKALKGKQALRFVKAEGDAGVENGRAKSCDVYRLVDLRPLKASAEGFDAMLEMSAQFLDGRVAKGPLLNFSCRIYLFSGSAESVREQWPSIRDKALAFGQSVYQSSGGAPQTWRDVTARVLLPRQADFAVVQLTTGRTEKSDGRPAEFGDQFADEVQLTLKTQPALPVRLTQR